MSDEQIARWTRWREALAQADSAAVTALDAYPQDDQIDMVCEECAELIAAIHRRRRGRTDTKDQDVAGEIADVIIMAFQAARMYGMDNTVEAIMAKSERLMLRAADAIGMRGYRR
jgi:hypothetical protein